MLTAVIFDFDGIIVDTEPIHFRAFQEVLRPLGLGYSWEDYLERYIGFDDRDAFREVFRLSGRELDDSLLASLIDRKAQVFEEIVGKGVQPYPGVIELITSLSGTLPLALCSGALERDIRPILGQLGIQKVFDVIVTADDVRASKPDPESYRLALERLCAQFPEEKITADSCLAIEDTPAGIASARTAGLAVLAVTNSYPEEKLSGAVSVTDSLTSVTIATLTRLAGGVS
ncbi:MAG: HAD family phosphatase [Geobacteraceae bacterium]|nr:HAD family phosphatase [Geobacteraceae bacterium]